ncbi:MAG: hypothetical protein RIQ81_1849 [Pseudomonadota bacterium]|jgi:putative hemolysin
MLSQKIIQNIPSLRLRPAQRPTVRQGKVIPIVEFSRGDFLVKTVRSKRELLQVQSLRYDVFHREYKQKKFPFGLDLDRFDAWSDHLVIMDQKTGCFVGTYRLLLEGRAPYFYSETEFDMSPLKAISGVKLELSRACIHKEYRNGTVIGLLWRGLVQYVQAAGVDFLFGMSSVKTMDPADIARVYRELRAAGNVDETLPCLPIEGFRVPGFHRHLEAAERNPLPDSGDMIPALLKSYLRAGAKVIGEPSVDPDFKCADFLTLLDMRNLGKAYERKFKLC